MTESTKVMVFGTFDIIHPGHLNFFRQAKKLGTKLFVLVARDTNVVKQKGEKPKFDENKRLEKVKQLSIVDHAILGDDKDPYLIIEKINPDIICLGYDQDGFSGKLKPELEKRNLKAKVIRLKPYRHGQYKSSKLRRIT